MDERKGRHAGVVLALMGLATYATTSPFGLVLSVEKLFETGRTGVQRFLDWTGAVFGGIGTLVLPLSLWGMFTYSLIGPVPVLCYLAALLAWVWYRVRVEWPKLRTPAV